ncbi:hypothetical protein SAMN02745146_0076 [Hymenobacter daecheongensis DSM 21074]|uniref:Uncharacterized protein n=1 Tax=Hymenobacter daecheongensis DSM 21074 TaxID=1121955 RepID=A0A1M6LW35_9BACT|nr:hypothetical protein [Hymenobacter daecheongensis]SHJ75381.1 hypothetical protein SAMN02745146_0076 [Hymenobacter daecheongensis DSM 21074]
MHSSIVLWAAALVSIGAADLFAHRDELTARRFRELSPATVAGELDRSRNRRWHRLGAQQRLVMAGVLASSVSLALGSQRAFWVLLLLCGALITLCFDISFNLRFGQRWWYAGTTALTDELLNKLGLKHQLNAGKLAAAVKLAAVLAGVAGWIFWL